MTGLPHREGGGFDWPKAPPLHLDDEATWAEQLAKALDLPTMAQRLASGALPAVTP